MTPAASVFVRRASLFAAIGAVLYAGLWAASEALVYQHADRNRFFAIRTAPAAPFDYVVLGASHAAALDYRDMTRRLEERTGKRVLNLAEVGSGVTMNRLLLDYFFTRHTTRAVVYVVDSFIFYSEEWNEARLGDAGVFLRAPFDPALARLLLREPSARSTALAYLTGFSKINNPDRFEPDTFPDEGARFDRAYRPVAQIDRQRLAYLYPAPVDNAVREKYLGAFESLVRDVRARGIAFLVVRPPLPERVRKQLPEEDAFDELLRSRVEPLGVEWHDFSNVANDEKFFYDTDHLNQAGVLNFFEHHLAPLLARE